MKKVSTAVAKQSRNLSQQKLTIGLDLGDRSSYYCVLDESGDKVTEHKIATTPKALQAAFAAMPRSQAALETGMHSPWVSRLLSALGHEDDCGACSLCAADRRKSQQGRLLGCTDAGATGPD